MKKRGSLLLLFLAVSLSIPALAFGAAKEPMPVPVYAGRVTTNLTIRETPSREAEGVGSLKEGETAYILGYEPGWLMVVDGNEDAWVTGYVLRHTVHDVEAIKEETMPYGATPAAYSGTLRKDAVLREAPDAQSDEILTMTEGTRLAILSIEDGWAQVIRWRQYGYVYLDAIAELTPVYDKETAQEGDTIAAFISFFNLSDKGLNPNRIVNIGIACDYISMTLAPGEDFSFNGIAGPYRKTRGYFEAPSFVGGETVPSYGGGTCQVSSTLYNVLLPLKEDISILYRVAHGAGGASYLPHGVDAACGNERIDLKFRNDFDFPVRIEATAHHGVLYIALVKGK